jgi:hypothetical protein
MACSLSFLLLFYPIQLSFPYFVDEVCHPKLISGFYTHMLNRLTQGQQMAQQEVCRGHMGTAGHLLVQKQTA